MFGLVCIFCAVVFTPLHSTQAFSFTDTLTRIKSKVSPTNCKIQSPKSDAVPIKSSDIEREAAQRYVQKEIGNCKSILGKQVPMGSWDSLFTAIGKFLLRDRSYTGLRRIFIPPPHGTEAKSAFGEIKTFSIKRWNRLISSHLLIKQVILPGLYPWPNYPQVFPMMRLKRFSSSVVFVCVRGE